MADDTEERLHRVRQGETTASLAAEHGVHWETVWNHPRNAKLRALRRNPNVLREGDEVFVPPRERRWVTCVTRASHKFVWKGTRSHIALRCLDIEGNPRSGEPFVLIADGETTRGRADEDGVVRAKLHPGVRRATLTIGDPRGEDHETHELAIGHLDPVDHLEGICDRLHNLGYYRGPRLGEPDATLLDAIAHFRADEALPASDEIDDELRAALVSRHGG